MKKLPKISGNEEIVGNEDNEFAELAIHEMDPVEKGKQDLEIHGLKWREYAVTFIFCLIGSFIAFIAIVFCFLISKYAYSLWCNPSELKTFLTGTWRVLTGAAVVTVIQYFVWSLKK